LTDGDLRLPQIEAAQLNSMARFLSPALRAHLELTGGDSHELEGCAAHGDCGQPSIAYRALRGRRNRRGGAQVASKGAYPTREELARLSGLVPRTPAPSLYTDAVAELVAIGASIAANCERFDASCPACAIPASRESSW
jgi:hypothetical protein